MNYQDRIRERGKVFGLIELSSRRAMNCVKINSHNNIEHEMTKLLVCYELRKRGIDFYTETKLIGNSGIADIIYFNLKTGEGKIIEIMHSETLKKAKKKTSKYPGIEIMYLSTKGFDINKIDI
jgi:hypothetical protein